MGRSPEQFDSLARFVRPEDMSAVVRISADPERHLAWLQEDIDMGFDQIVIHNVNREQERFIDVFGDRVLPLLKKA